MYNILSKTDINPILLELKINEKPITFEVDSGAGVTIILEDIFKKALESTTNLSKTKYVRRFCN